MIIGTLAIMKRFAAEKTQAWGIQRECKAEGVFPGVLALHPEGRGKHRQFIRKRRQRGQHACATHNYERGVDLVAIQQMLGHWHVGTTMRYVTPSATFIEDAYRRAVSGALAGLEGDSR